MARNLKLIIICKLIRRSVKEQILHARMEISKVNPTRIDLSENACLSNAIVFEHLTPEAQNLLAEATKVKN